MGEAIYSLTDFYCVEPNCTCEEVSINVMRLGEGDDPVEVGEILINPTFPSAALFRAHGEDREALKHAWAAFSAQQPIPELLFARRTAMRRHAAEIHRLFGAPARASKMVSRNDPCPCGSGLKFKKCCLDKA